MKFKSGVELSQKIRSDEISCEEVILKSISESKKWNPLTNAIVEDRFDQAVETAKNLDSKLEQMNAFEREKLPPFWGVPFTCKEMFSINGLKSTLGSVPRKDRRMNFDSTVYTRLLKAGGVFLGTTNIPEMGFWFECDNAVYGPTKNPYNLKRTSGGSSGGEAAAISSGVSFLGLGSDLGGSIRTPASFCGIFGHKPTPGLIPITGHFQADPENLKNIDMQKFPLTSAGPMARSAEDLKVLFRVIKGPDGIDPSVTHQEINNFSRIDLKDINFYFIESPLIQGMSSIESEVSEKVSLVRSYFEAIDVKSQSLPDKLFMNSFEMWVARAQKMQTQDFADIISPEATLSIGWEFLKLAVGNRKFTFPALLTAFLNKLQTTIPNQEALLEELHQLRNFLISRLGSQGILILPVHPRPAPVLNSTYTRPFDFALTAIFNALGFPSTSVPVGFSKQGLPIGVQIVSIPNNDEMCLKIAEILEKVFGGWEAPR